MLPAVGITIRICRGDKVPGQDNQVRGQSCEMRKKILAIKWTLYTIQPPSCLPIDLVDVVRVFSVILDQLANQESSYGRGDPFTSMDSGLKEKDVFFHGCFFGIFLIFF